MRLRQVAVAACAVAVISTGWVASSSGGVKSAAGPAGYIVVLQPGANRSAVVAQARSLGADVSMEYRHALNGFAARLSAKAVAKLQANPA